MVETEEVPAVQACAVAGNVVFSDGRGDTKAGERATEDAPGAKQPITATGDAIEWMRAGTEALARMAVLRLNVADRPQIRIALTQLWLDEVVYRRAEFDARVVLDVTVTSSDGARTCFSDRVRGTAENYGYAGKAENYQETVNHALDRALTELLSSPGFTDAVCACSGDKTP